MTKRRIHLLTVFFTYYLGGECNMLKKYYFLTLYKRLTLFFSLHKIEEGGCIYF